MIVTCPACITRFEVNPVALGPKGRKVRCIRCFTVWHQDPEAGTEFVPPVNAPLPPAFAQSEPLPNFMMESSVALTADETADELDFVFTRRRPPPKPASSRDLINPVAWGALGIAIILFGVVAVLGRDSIVARWPFLDAAYASVGLEAEAIGAGLELRGINSAIIPANGKVSLVVAGEVANVSSIPRSVPALTIRLRDNANNVLVSWKITPQAGKLPPGETMPFQTSMPSPPAGASSAVVTFQP